MSNVPSQQSQQQKEAQAKQMEEQRQQTLSSILSAEAKERLGRIRLVKPEKARMVEDMLISTVRQRKLTSQVSDEQLIDLLNKVGAQEQTSVTIAHRKSKADEGWDDDDEGW